MAYYEENRQAIISYFQQGSRGDALSQNLGVEIEHFVVRTENNKPVPYRGASEEGFFGVADLLQNLSALYPKKTYGLEGDLIGLASSEASITLEPAAQIEISIAPYESIETILSVYEAFREQVDPFLARHGCKLVAKGYHPSAKALDLPLIPKKRYQFMNDYFQLIGTHGERMMRASASTQVSVDFKDEADAIRKMRLAQALAPILSLITDNSSVFEGAPTTKPLERFNLWRDVDNDRCGSVPGLFNEGYGFAQYTDWLLGTSPIFVTRPAANDIQGSKLCWVGKTSAAEAYADAPMSESDIEHVLSMFWPDVRLKRFVEIRPADSLPAAQVAGYAALIKGIFYSDEAMDFLEEKLGVKNNQWPFNDETVNHMLEAIRLQGVQAVFAGYAISEWVSMLFETAKSHLSEKDQTFLEQLSGWFYTRQVQ